MVGQRGASAGTRAPAEGPRTNNLPAQLTSFVGRAAEVAEVKRLLAGARLLTITGSGGCGKTRLALEVAAALLPDYPAGIWLVELAALSDPSLVPSAVASALDVVEQPRRSVTQALVAALQSKVLLLLLDNCEHLLPACAVLAGALLRGCPRLRLLATSRAVLGIEGETRWRVPSLSLPDPTRIPPIKRITDYEAAQLFIERARASLPTFALTNRNARAVMQICSRLDGIPLAIELAAARTNVLAVEQIAVRLDDRFRLLAGSSPTAVPRHQTLQAAVDWSYDLLSEKEQAVFRRLSVFAGGWALAAAEAICSGNSGGASEILDLLTQLVDKSLVVADTRGTEARYRLLETVREYGLNRLRESGEATVARRRHFDWYLALAEQAEPELRGPGPEPWMDRLETEHDNLRAALEWSATEPDDAERELHLAGALQWFWFIHGHWTEGRRWLEGALERGKGTRPSSLAKVLQAATLFALRQGDYERTMAVGEKGVALCRELGDRENGTLSLLWVGSVFMRQGDYTRATALFEESLSQARQLADKWRSSVALSHLGDVARCQGEYERAAVLHGQSLALSREVGDKSSIGYRLLYLGWDTLRQGDYGRAADYFRESLGRSRELGDRSSMAEGLRGVGEVARAQRQHRKAARLFGAAELVREALGWRPYPPDQRFHEESVAAVRAALGEAAFATAWVEGQASTLDQAVEYALAPADAKLQRTMPSGKPATGQQGGLTPRERDVAALVARGLTNREIASRLVISERTVDAHVQHILNRLGFNSRAQIAGWTVEHRPHE